MRDLIRDFKRFDGVDWVFFGFLGFCVLMLLAIALVCLFGGAPVWVAVLGFIATFGIAGGWVHATLFAMGRV